MEYKFGKVPRPSITQKIIAGVEGVNFDYTPANRRNIGTVVHRMDGPLRGTYNFFNTPGTGALADYGIGGELDAAEGLDGAIWEFVDPNGNREPYANGGNSPTTPPRGDGIPFKQKYGGYLNRLLVSIETSGCSGYPDSCTDGSFPAPPETPVSRNQFEALSHLIAYIHDQAQVPFDTFPYYPDPNTSGTDVITCLEHWNFSEKDCPYPLMKAERPKYHARAVEWMKHYQTGQEGDFDPGVTLPEDGAPGTPGDGPAGVFEINDKIKTNTGGIVNLRSGPSTTAAVVTELPKGTELCVLSGSKAADGYNWYQVKKVSGSQQGYVAGDLCTRVAKNGCGTGAPKTPFAAGDRIKTISKTKLVSSPGNASTPAPTAEMKVTDPIRSPQRGASETAIAFARDAGSLRLNDVIAYVNEIYRLAPTLEFDPAILIAQSALETNYWGQGWWNDRLNPAGLGITGDSVQDQQSQNFPNGTASARAQLAHMHAYVYGTTRSLPSDLVGADNRYNTVLSSGNAGKVVTINDLTSKWAVDTQYAPKIVTRGNEIFGQVIQAAAAPPPAGKKIADLTQGTELCVTGAPTSADGFDWFPVERYELKGFVAAAYVDIVEQGGCTATTPEPTPTAKFKTKDKVRVFDGPLNLRSAASTSAQILSSFAIGTDLCVTSGPTRANGYEWYQVSGGWIAGDFCNLVRSGGCGTGTTPGLFTVNDRIAVTDGPLNIRGTPTTQAAVVGDYATGTELCVLEGPVRAKVFEWYRVSAQGKAGWIAGNYCRLVAADGCTSTPVDGRFGADDRIYIAVAELNLRTAPSTTAPILTVLTGGIEACVVAGPRYAGGLDWYRVRTAGREGWLAGQYAGLAQDGGCRTGVGTSAFRLDDRVRVADGPLHLRQEPNLNGTVITMLPTWTQLCVRSTAVTYADGYAWYSVSANGQTGYVAGVYCELVAAGGCLYSEGPVTAQAAPVSPSGVPLGTVLVGAPALAGKVNVRSSTSATSTSKGVLGAGQYAVVMGAAVLANGHSWHPVETIYGAGWVAADETVKQDLIPVDRNWAGNSVASTSLAYIFANAASTTLSREFINSNATVKAQNAGTQGYEGVRYESQPNLNQPGSGRHLVGVVDVLGSGTINLIVVRVRYTDGTFGDSASAPAITLIANKWQRVVTPRIAASAAKTISKVELHIVRSTAAGVAWSFNTDNAKLIVLGPPTPAPQWTHRVTNGPLNLRTASNTSATVIGAMPNGTRLRIISGPVSNQGYSWYSVDAEDFGQGWCVNGFDPI